MIWLAELLEKFEKIFIIFLIELLIVCFIRDIKMKNSCTMVSENISKGISVFKMENSCIERTKDMEVFEVNKI